MNVYLFTFYAVGHLFCNVFSQIPKNPGGYFSTYFDYKYFLPLLLIFDLKFIK
nr:MAG TPA: hypothetical protein [Caudoviricetes sp.]